MSFNLQPNLRGPSFTPRPARGGVRRLLIGGLLASMAALSGCQTMNAQVNSEQSAEKIALDKQIDAALARVNSQPRWSTSLDDRAAFASFNTDSVNVSYQGSAADLLKAIAASRGASFKVTGPNPHLPIFVFVEAKGQPFEDFLRDLDKQMGQRADVVQADNAFELRYR